MSTLKKVKIVAEYKGKNYYFDIESFKPCFHIEKHIRKIIFTSNELLVSYMNRIIQLSKLISISEFFHGKSTITFKVIERDLSMMPQLPIINYKDHSPSKPEIYSSYLNENDTLYDTMNRSSDNSRYNYSIDNKYLKANSTNLCDCAMNYVHLFCRNCKTFICKRCRAKPDHFSHDMVIIDMTKIEDCLNLYCNYLKTDVIANMKAFAGYQKDLDKYKFSEISSRKEIIIKKINELEKKQKEMLKISSQANDSKKVVEIQKTSNKITSEIDEVFNKIRNDIKLERNVSFETASKYFLDINNVENKVKEINEFIFNFKLDLEINKKLDSNYKFLEKALENIQLTNNNIFKEFSFLDEEIFDLNLINKYKIQLESSINLLNNNVIDNPNINSEKIYKDSLNNSISSKNYEGINKNTDIKNSKQKDESSIQIKEEITKGKKNDKFKENSLKEDLDRKNNGKEKRNINRDKSIKNN